MKKGIDISGWQDFPNWDKIATSGIDFAVFRCHEQYGVDKSFEHNYNGAVSHGIPVGVYKLSYATNESDALKEAKNVISVLNGKKIDLPVFYDLEWEVQFDYGKKKIESIAITFLNALKNAGYEVGVYCSTYWYDNVISNKLKKYPMWVASVPDSNKDDGTIQEYLHPEYADMWQYSWNGTISGISGGVDMDILYNESLLGNKNVDNTTKEEVSMSVPDVAACWMEALAKDDSHGYDQIYRWGEKGDYDCSSAVITAYETAGVPVKSKGATYTGNMKNVFLNNGFIDVTNQINLSSGSGLVRGDVLLNEVHHTALYCGDGLEVEASINEKGGATGGTPGDQTTREILIRTYRNYPWNCVLRYTGNVKPYLFKGCKGEKVAWLQESLNTLIFSNLDVDGDFGKLTDNAVKTFQSIHGLEIDGIVGKATEQAIKDELEKLNNPVVNVENKCYTARVKVPVREAAKTKSGILTRIPEANKEVELTGKKVEYSSGSVWYQVQVGDILGWVHASNLIFKDIEV